MERIPNTSWFIDGSKVIKLCDKTALKDGTTILPMDRIKDFFYAQEIEPSKKLSLKIRFRGEVLDFDIVRHSSNSQVNPSTFISWRSNKVYKYLNELENKVLYKYQEAKGSIDVEKYTKLEFIKNNNEEIELKISNLKEDEGVILEKYIDKSTFKYGITIPKANVESFLSNIDSQEIKRGTSKEIQILFDDYKLECKIFNIDRKGTTHDAYQIRYDSNKDFIEYLINKFEYTYKQIELENKDLGMQECIKFYIGKEKNTFEAKYEINKEKGSLDMNKLKNMISYFEQNYSFDTDKDDNLRDEFITKFPMKSLITLPLEKYALGKMPDNLCWWLEFNTVPLGSIKGGNAKKFKIYYANKEEKWVYPNNYSNVEEAWDDLRSSINNFINNFSLGNYDALNDGSPITSMNMFKTKLLYMYFPDKLLPIYSVDHIHKLLILFGYNEEVNSWDIIKSNMELKSLQNSKEEFKNWNGIKFMRFIYYMVLPKNNGTSKVVGGGEDLEVVEQKIYTPKEVSSFMKSSHNYIKSQGYNYTEHQLSNLYLSLKTKPFVILAGISGTGKSKIVRLLAESLGATKENNQYNTISVRPDWNDSTELIGYKNLNDDFIEGQLTKIIKKAINNKTKPYFICLDEMNLARVEYYLSDYLSIIESRKNIGEEIITDNIIEDTEKNLYLPENLYIIGTVNMDDTTFTFSRKVLDRANTIEFSDVDLEDLFGNEIEDEIEVLDIDNNFLKTTYLKTTDIEEEQRDYAKAINNKIVEINNILKKAQKQFAYRVRDEILFYMVENNKADLLSEDLAFDYQIMQKVLPAISGSERSIGEILVELFNFVCGKNIIEEIDTDKAREYIESDNQREEKDKIKYINSAKKILYMLKGYENDGYVSYWY